MQPGVSRHLHQEARCRATPGLLQILPRCGKVISRRDTEPPSDGYKRPWPRSLRAAQRRDAADKRRSNGARFARAFINAPLAADLGVRPTCTTDSADSLRGEVQV
jgi:hypothetical protein